MMLPWCMRPAALHNSVFFSHSSSYSAELQQQMTLMRVQAVAGCLTFCITSLQVWRTDCQHPAPPPPSTPRPSRLAWQHTKQLTHSFAAV
jgi:hypothetical protein